MNKFQELIKGRSDSEVAEILCFDVSEVFRLRKALEVKQKVCEEAEKRHCDITMLEFNKVRPLAYYHIGRVSKEHWLPLALKCSKEKLTVEDVILEVNRLLGLVKNPFAESQGELYDFECPCGRRYRIEWAKERIEQVKS